MRVKFMMLVMIGCSVFPLTSATATTRMKGTAICPNVSIPNEVVRALIQVESKGNRFALGAMIEGVHVSFYPGDIGTATLMLQELLKRTDNVGIGLMQVNYVHHIKGTDIDPITLFDHVRNLDMGCRILGQAIASSPTLWEGIGRYHSHTPMRTRQYAIRVLQHALKGMAHE